MPVDEDDEGLFVPLSPNYSVKAEITLPKANRPLLILIPYFSLYPVAPVLLALSEPARSTK